MPARPNYNIDIVCSGCRSKSTVSNKSKEYKAKLCKPCYQEWDDLDRKGTAYLKELRKHAPWST